MNVVMKASFDFIFTSLCSRSKSKLKSQKLKVEVPLNCSP